MPSSIPVADLEVFFADPASREALAECRKVAESFIVNKGKQTWRSGANLVISIRAAAEYWRANYP